MPEGSWPRGEPLDPGTAPMPKDGFPWGEDIDPGFGRPATNGGCFGTDPSLIRSDRPGTEGGWYRLPLCGADTSPGKPPLIAADSPIAHAADTGGKLRTPIAQGGSAPQVRVLDAKQLQALNPNVIGTPSHGSEAVIAAFNAAPAFADKFGRSRRISENTFVLTRPVSIGSGYVLPLGTKIRQYGSSSGYTSNDIASGPPVLNFILPNGKRLTTAARVPDGKPSSTTITFPDGTQAKVSGVPYFNSTTGELGRLTEADTKGRSLNDNPSAFKLNSTLFDSSVMGAQPEAVVRDGSIKRETNDIKRSLTDTLK